MSGHSYSNCSKQFPHHAGQETLGIIGNVAVSESVSDETIAQG